MLRQSYLTNLWWLISPSFPLLLHYRMKCCLSTAFSCRSPPFQVQYLDPHSNNSLMSNHHHHQQHRLCTRYDTFCLDELPFDASKRIVFANCSIIYCAWEYWWHWIHTLLVWVCATSAKKHISWGKQRFNHCAFHSTLLVLILSPRNVCTVDL